MSTLLDQTDQYLHVDVCYPKSPIFKRTFVVGCGATLNCCYVNSTTLYMGMLS